MLLDLCDSAVFHNGKPHPILTICDNYLSTCISDDQKLCVR